VAVTLILLQRDSQGDMGRHGSRCVDIGTLASGLVMGEVRNTTASIIGGAAVGAISIAILGLKGL
jgi:hypothetical protein